MTAAGEIRYQEWLPSSAALRGIVTAYWRVTGDGARFPPSAVLPDGHVELVLNSGDPVALAGPAYMGDQPQRAVVGLLSRALRLEYRGRVDMFGIRFHPARGAGFFGLPATELTDTLAPAARICPALDGALVRLIGSNPDLEEQASRNSIDGVLLDRLPEALPPDPAIVMLVDRMARSESPSGVASMACDLGLSPRHLQRRFRSAVGLPPKRFLRVMRFARVWQVASMHRDRSWAELAAEFGFADQAHLVREFRAFGADPPTRVFTPEWYGSTALSRASGPAEGVRFIQDPPRRTRL